MSVIQYISLDNIKRLLSKLINDTTASSKSVYSSQKVDELLTDLPIPTGALTKEVVTELPDDASADSDTIYLIDGNSDSNPTYVSEIDDSQSSTTTTYSSEKIDSAINEVKSNQSQKITASVANSTLTLYIKDL